ncbi:cytochrome P450 [Novosphingobium marinum]|uniref:Cytochrome P450 n=1 Tax=Novosphingobium marinum TaxID=1514948 RepID=A0A7Z0BRJ1_9SPHN|nr:cytochrome P450 [Novosphingobium marinum]NYH93891.1 cytochrome P450 [Novosphingobium marinum]GGC18058.1 cytochrome P450 [Novosphingobium marinum]
MATIAGIPAHVPSDRVVDFDIFAPPGVEEDYWAAWKSLRGPHGIVWTTANGGHWIATDGAITRDLWADAERLSSESLAVTPGLGEVMDFIPLQQDPPEHKPFRMAVMKGFANQYVTAMEPLVREVSSELAEGLAPKGGCEFMSEFAEILPIHVFLTLIGVPTEDRTKLRPLGQQLTRPDGSMTVVELRDAADAYLEPYVRARLENPGTDLFSRILSVPIEGRAWTFGEAQRMCRNLLFGGLDTVVAMLGNFAMHLAQNPADQALLREDRTLIPQAADELMRRYPTVSVTRNLVADVEVDGITMKDGDLVYLSSALHNLDPDCFDDPERVDFARNLQPVRHTTMGVGAHRCVGAGLARMEAITFLEEWLDRIPEFRIAEGTKPRFRGGNVAALTDLRLSW